MPNESLQSTEFHRCERMFKRIKVRSPKGYFVRMVQLAFGSLLVMLT